jgi:phosphate:Na+ symporter
MKEGFEAFKDSIDLAAYAIPGIKGLIVFTLIGIAATVIMQSSHATLVLIITALAAQQITYENALALAIGANVGTTITAILGAISSNVEGKRLAGAHLVFNVVTGIIAIAFIQQFLLAVNAVSEAVGIASEDYTLKLAVFHTLFNLVGVIVMLPFTGRLVGLLEHVMQEKARGVSEPRYLNDAVLEVPDAAVEAVRKETRHLFDNAFDVIAQALNLSPQRLRSAEPLEQLVAQPRQVQRFDIDEHYARRIKSLYSAIVVFTSKAQAGNSEAQNEILFGLRQAGHDLVEAVKDIKHLQKNLVRYLASPNEDLRQAYNRIRRQLAEVLREVVELENSDDMALAALSLDGVKVAIEENDILVNGDLDRLIRGQRISAAAATSLMNDSAYAYDVAANLVAMARVVFLPAEDDLRTIENEIFLNEAEIDDVLEESAKDTGRS